MIMLIIISFFPQVFPYMSFYNDSQTGQLRVHGMFGSLLGNITQSLNMTYELFKPEDGRFGTPQIEPEKMNGQLAMVIVQFDQSHKTSLQYVSD